MTGAITTWLELVGLALIVLGLGVFVAQFSLAGGLVVAGVATVGVSALVKWRES